MDKNTKKIKEDSNKPINSSQDDLYSTFYD